MSDPQDSESPNADAQSSPTEKSERRPVSYSNLTAVLEDARFLASHPHRTVGQWSYGRILQHLAESLNKSFDGFHYRAALPIRLVARIFLKKRLLNEPMSPGFKLPKSQEALLPDNSQPVELALENLRTAVARFEREEPTAEHPALGSLTPAEWVKLHLRHCELHMSFVKPA